MTPSVPFPENPEHALTWTEPERAVILAYGMQCFDEGAASGDPKHPTAIKREQAAHALLRLVAAQIEVYGAIDTFGETYYRINRYLHNPNSYGNPPSPIPTSNSS